MYALGHAIKLVDQRFFIKTEGGAVDDFQNVTAAKCGWVKLANAVEIRQRPAFLVFENNGFTQRSFGNGCAKTGFDDLLQTPDLGFP